MVKGLVGNAHPTVTHATLSDICKTTSGGTPSRQILSYFSGNIPWVKSGELEDCYIYETEEHITKEAVENSSAKIFPAETLLIALYGATVGKLGILKVRAATNQAICAIFHGKDVDRDYLYFYLLTQRESLIESGSGGAQSNISQDIIRDLKIPLPPLEEQRRIADIATKADRLRRTRRYAQQLSDTYLQSVFLEMFGDPVSNPKGWKQGYFSELIASTQNGLGQRKDFDSQGTIVLRIKDVRTGFIDYSDLRRMAVPEADIQKYQLNNDDLILVRVNGNPNLVGRAVAFQAVSEPVVFSDHIIRVKLSPKLANAIFISHLLNSDYGKKEILSNIATTAGQFTVNSTGLSKIRLFFPPLPLQQKFATIVQRFERLRAQQREADRQAEHLFQSILHRAFRGEL